MARRRMGAIGTTEILLIGGAALAVYLLTKKTTPTVPTVITVPQGGTSAAALQAQAAQTTSEVNAGASVVNNLISTIWG